MEGDRREFIWEERLEDGAEREVGGKNEEWEEGRREGWVYIEEGREGKNGKEQAEEREGGGGRGEGEAGGGAGGDREVGDGGRREEGGKMDERVGGGRVASVLLVGEEGVNLMSGLTFSFSVLIWGSISKGSSTSETIEWLLYYKKW